MKYPKSSERGDDLTEARKGWAASFLDDWLLPLVKEHRIHKPSDIIELRKGFPPLVHEDDKGTDFTIQDVLSVALYGRAYMQQLRPGIRFDATRDGKVLNRTIDLLTEAVNNPPKSDGPEGLVQLSFLDDRAVLQ